MGVRLYINTESNEVIERMLGVKEGTLNLIEEKRNKMETDQFYDWLFDDKNEMARLVWDFNLYGFGKFDLSLVAEENRYGGTEKNFSKCTELLSTATNIDLVPIENTLKAIDKYGVCWS